MNNPTAMMFLTRLRNKDEYTSQHGFSVCVYSIILGRFLGLNPVELENLGTCGLLHDIGKLEIPDQILNKPGKLTPEEKAVMQNHTTRGREILLSGEDIFGGALDVAFGHHELLDGTGYPRGLQGHQMSTNCKIVAVVDKYDALTTHRPYRLGQDHLRAVALLNKMAKENKIDGKLAAGFISYLGTYPPGSIVEFNSGELGIVLGSSPEHRLQPQVLLVRDAKKTPIHSFTDLSGKVVDGNGQPHIVAVRNAGYSGIDISQYYDLLVHAYE
jgi:HD-GYP domain-containing protein (c-di-GMP phosphodiesterase class II)